MICFEVRNTVFPEKVKIKGSEFLFEGLVVNGYPFLTRKELLRESH